jgi:hypothetical protein
MARRAKSLLRLDAVRVEGALIQPDIVAKVANGEAERQDKRDYGIEVGLNLRDEIGRAYQIAKGYWDIFENARSRANAEAAHRAFAAAILTRVLSFDLADSRRFRANGAGGFECFTAGEGRVPIAIAGADGVDRVEAVEVGGRDSIRRSATTLVQGELNSSEKMLWGVATDGVIWRILRDSESITRPGYIEIDLARVMRDDLYADFSAFWLLAHRSRFPKHGAADSDCALERWRQLGREQGVTAREDLRKGVQSALFHLGRGFLEDPANAALVARLNAVGTDRLTKEDFFRQLLRLVYRLIFIMTVEDREILHPEGADEAAKTIYANGYATERLRERSRNRIAWDRHHDAYEGMKALFRALQHGQPKLALPALGGIFSQDQTPDLDRARLANKRFLRGLYTLAWIRRDNVLSRINWRDMETEEFGSVYESLLELTPDITESGRKFSFVGEPDEDADKDEAAKRSKKGKGAKGNERKTTGSYYTPDSLVQLLLKEALNPVIERTVGDNPENAEALLKLKVIDPACGSGHFILGAARKIAQRLAELRHGGSATNGQYRHAMRDVARHCLHGVDRNPMAVELCRVAIWIETVEPGKPLTFMDQKVRCGDSLVGVYDFDMLRKGLPDGAFEPLTGDDKAVAKAYAAINEEQRDGKTASGILAELRMPAEIESGAAKLLAMPEETLAEVEAKRKAFEQLVSGENWWRLKSACDMYVAAFLAPKRGDVPDPRRAASLPIPTTEAIWRTLRSGDIHADVQAEAIDLAMKNVAFHWPLEFPAEMAKGGFDAVVGNPPWERIKLQEQEFFESREIEIAAAENKSERDRLIRALKEAAPGSAKARLSEEFEMARRAAEAASVFARKSGRFPLTGLGDVNTYALFAELFSRLSRSKEDNAPGRAGVLTPTGIATDSSTSAFFGDLVANNRLLALYDFENRDKLFPAVDSRVKFSILVIGPAKQAHFAAWLRKTADLEDKERQIELTPDDFGLVNPNTLTAPLYRTRHDRDLTRKIYRHAPVLICERENPGCSENPWGVTFQRLFDMATDSKLFETAAQLSRQGFRRDESDWRHEDGRRYVPLFEAKMIHHFDHRFGSYAGLRERPGDGSLPETPDSLKASPDYEPEPWYWVPEEEASLRVARVPTRLKQYYRKAHAVGCLKVLAEWVLGTLDPEDLAKPAFAVSRAQARLTDVLGPRALERDCIGAKVATWVGNVAGDAREMQRETPLTEDDLRFIKATSADPLELTLAMIGRKQPRWLMGWRDITNATNERTVIASIFPKVGAGDKVLIMHHTRGVQTAIPLVAALSSFIVDYAARQKFGGTSFKYYFMKQLPLLAPHQITRDERDFVSPRVLELTYTSHSLRAWAEDSGYFGPPFGFDLERRASLRAELDAFFARKYGLTRDELRYVLDPQDVKGEAYPSETFRGLKAKEMTQYDEFRTARLVLEAWDRQSNSREAA